MSRRSYGYNPYYEKQRQRKRIFTGLFVGVVVLLLFGAHTIFAGRHDPVVTYSAAQASQIPPPTPSPSPTLTFSPTSSPIAKATVSPATASNSQLETDIKTVLADYPVVDCGVTIIDLKSGKIMGINDTKSFFAASTAKLFAATTFLKGVESGKYSLNDPLGNYDAKFQLQQMINQSNNVSWDLFITLLTRSKERDFALKYGLTSYQPNGNTVAPHDMALLLQKLYQGQILNDEHTKLLFSYMHATNEERFIPPALSSGTKIYHKTGLYVSYAHDAAIIDDGSHPFVLVIFTDGKGSQDYNSRAKLFQAVTKVALKDESKL